MPQVFLWEGLDNDACVVFPHTTVRDKIQPNRHRQAKFYLTNIFFVLYYIMFIEIIEIKLIFTAKEKMSR